MFDTTVLVNLLAGLGLAFTSAPAWAGELSHARREGECDPLLAGNIHWAVKTCSKHHNSRVPAVRETWGSLVNSLEFYSDKAEPNLGVTSLGGMEPTDPGGYVGDTGGQGTLLAFYQI